MPAQTRATNGQEEINNDRSVDYGNVLLYNSVGNNDNHCNYSAIHDLSTPDYVDDYDNNNEENASNKSDGHRNGPRKLEAQIDQGKLSEIQLLGQIPRKG